MSTGAADLSSNFAQISDQRIEPAGVDIRLALVALQAFKLVVQLLVDFTSYVASARRSMDLSWCGAGGLSPGFHTVAQLNPAPQTR